MVDPTTAFSDTSCDCQWYVTLGHSLLHNSTNKMVDASRDCERDSILQAGVAWASCDSDRMIRKREQWRETPSPKLTIWGVKESSWALRASVIGWILSRHTEDRIPPDWENPCSGVQRVWIWGKNPCLRSRKPMLTSLYSMHVCPLLFDTPGQMWHNLT